MDRLADPPAESSSGAGREGATAAARAGTADASVAAELPTCLLQLAGEQNVLHVRERIR